MNLERPGFANFARAVERLERRLRQVTSELDKAGIAHAVIGGNAVASWVESVCPAGTRTTRNIDLLIDTADVHTATETILSLGLTQAESKHLAAFDHPAESSRIRTVQLFAAGQPIRPTYAYPAPTLRERTRDQTGMSVVTLPALIRMKLTSNRMIDRVHIDDMLSVALINATIRTSLPPDLLPRLDEIEQQSDNRDFSAS